MFPLPELPPEPSEAWPLYELSVYCGDSKDLRTYGAHKARGSRPFEGSQVGDGFLSRLMFRATGFFDDLSS